MEGMRGIPGHQRSDLFQTGEALIPHTPDSFRGAWPLTFKGKKESGLLPDPDIPAAGSNSI